MPWTRDGGGESGTFSSLFVLCPLLLASSEEEEEEGPVRSLVELFWGARGSLPPPPPPSHLNFPPPPHLNKREGSREERERERKVSPSLFPLSESESCPPPP